MLSSATLHISESRLIRQTSLMMMLNSRGPSTDPCGTPIFTFPCGTSMGTDFYPLIAVI